ncbi:hypothetical protein CBS101457_005107 [Exobasidium rhododendri]|nr:hypothetical protein CBS101457_005107 [Exobasidium rhododendri]
MPLIEPLHSSKEVRKWQRAFVKEDKKFVDIFKEKKKKKPQEVEEAEIFDPAYFPPLLSRISDETGQSSSLSEMEGGGATSFDPPFNYNAPDSTLDQVFDYSVRLGPDLRPIEKPTIGDYLFSNGRSVRSVKTRDRKGKSKMQSSGKESVASSSRSDHWSHQHPPEVLSKGDYRFQREPRSLPPFPTKLNAPPS